MTEEKKVNGRPRKEVDWEKVDVMCKLHCTAQEIVAYLNGLGEDVSYDTYDRRAKEEFDCTFAEYIAKRTLGQSRPRLRQLQWKAAEAGNTSILIWLGKQYLDQSDKSQTDHTSSDGSMTPRNFNDFYGGDEEDGDDKADS